MPLNEIILKRTQILVGNIPKDIFNQISSTKTEVSDRAIQTLISPLNQNDDIDTAVFQTLPLYFLQEGFFEESLAIIKSYLQNGHSISLEVLKRIFDSISKETETQEKEEENFDFCKSIRIKVSSIINLLSKKSKNSKDVEFLLFLAEEYEKLGKIKKAIGFYDMLIEFGDERGLLKAALAYKKLGEIEVALQLINFGFIQFRTEAFLQQKILLLCEIGKLQEAKTIYKELGNYSFANSELLSPFILYSQTIENDEDLKILAFFIGDYIKENCLYHIPALTKLVKNASNYIEIEFHKVNKKLKKIKELGVNNYTKKQEIKSRELILGRLYLTYIDIFVLKNTRYIETHIVDLDGLAFSLEEGKIGLLKDFIDMNFSINKKDEEDEKEDFQVNLDIDLETKIEAQINNQNVVFYELINYVSQLVRSHIHGGNYKVFEKKIIPLFQKCKDKLIGAKALEIQYLSTLDIIRNESHFLRSLNSDLFTIYDNLIFKIEQKYGVFYRVHIQALARYKEIDETNFPKIFLEDNLVACLFFCEKLIAKLFLNESQKENGFSGKELNIIIEKFKLNNLYTDEALLFGSLLKEIIGSNNIFFLYQSYGVLNDIFGIYIILENLFLLYEDEYSEILKGLDNYCKEMFGKDFFTYIKSFLQNFEKLKDLSYSEKKYIELSKGTLELILKNGEKYENDALDNFLQANKYQSTEALLHAGILFEKYGDIKEALFYYEKAFNLKNNITTLVKILSLTITNGLFNIAGKYIDFGVRNNYHIEQYILANLLWQGKKIESYKQFIILKNKGIEFLDVPTGTQNLLIDSINYTFSLDSSITNTEFQKEKILALYIESLFNSNIYNILTLLHIFLNTPIENLSELINETLGVILGSVIDIKENIDENAIMLLDYFGYLYYNLLREELLNNENRKNLAGVKNTFKLINEFTGLIFLILKRLPNSSGVLEKWQTSLSFIKYQGTNIFDEKICSTTTIH